MTPKRRMPAEWEPHRATWVAWPSDAELWRDDLEPAQGEFAAMCRGIVASPQPAAGRAAVSAAERLEVLVCDARGERAATAALGGLPVRFHSVAFGDIWLRDTAPSFQRAPDGGLIAACFRFNGWGGKYVLDGDDVVATRVAEIAGARIHEVDLVAEGGAVEVDGEGTCLTTRQCVLNPNRNPGVDERTAERLIAGAVGAERVIWLDRGLANDHTDGHIDTLARFVAPGVVACMEPRDADDPNRDVLLEILTLLRGASDARGRRLEVVTVPSPGAVLGADRRPMPASYLNFYISNFAVVVPTYGVAYDDEAVSNLTRLFPGRVVLGSSARAVLTGGGAFHCITQQEPLLAGARAR